MVDESQYKFTRLQICKRFVETVRHSMELGLEVVSAVERRVRVRMAWQEKLVGNPDTRVIHGGAVFALMDQAGGLANACASYPHYEITPTIDMRVDHLRAPAPGEAVVCEAECYRLSQHVTFVRMRVFGENAPDEELATGLATYMRMQVPGAAGVIGMKADAESSQNSAQNNDGGNTHG